MANETKALVPDLPNKAGDGINFPTTKPNTSALAAATRVASMQAATPAPVERPPQFYMPALWDIVPDGDGIIATHNVLGDVFKGTRKEFSSILSGK
jgi:hypothetical protein